MSTQQATTPAAVQPPPLDEDLVFKTIADASRRKILLSLARRSPQTAAELQVGRRLDTTRKHLEHLRKSGMVIMTENPADRRKAHYSLTSLVRVFRSEHGAVIDFGGGTVRL